ncbi:DNA primase [Candidatus Azambacteria bacterium]|nr:DNA primase [Candidatus Azambacteria bacterium]MBI3685575.1 DNA primase [Candidatus Azambacteria bacterium]
MSSTNFPSEEIKARLNVNEVLSGYIRLQKQGANWRGLCPFHNEKTPSFYVSPARQIWHCFGCGEGGDIFKFVMKMEGVEFVDALRLLAKKAGVQLKSKDPKAASERVSLLQACAHAAQFFQNNLESTIGAEAKAYLLGRGLTEETMSEFRIGFAPEGWDNLHQYLALKGIKPDTMEKAGLAIASDKSGKRKYFDRFRDRIMFPIADAHGDVIGFTGRYLKEKKDEGKYVNSPQTPLYNKSAILYGVDKAKTEIRKKDAAVLVEGQMDMLMSWQDGVKHVVAVSGTAFTREQLDLLKRYTKNLCLLFDADLAGDAATKRSIALAMGRGFAISVAGVPEGKDAADFVREHPGGKLAEEITKAVSVMDYYFRSVFARYDIKKVEDKKQIGNIILAQIKKIPNKIEAHHWLEKLSLALGVKMEYLEDEMKRIKDDEAFLEEEKAEKGVQAPKKHTALDKLLEHLMALVYSAKDDAIARDLTEKLSRFEFLGRLAADRMFAEEATSRDVISVFDLFLKYGRMGNLSRDFSDELDEAGKSVQGEVFLMSELETYPELEKETLFCASRIEKELIGRELAKLEMTLRQAEAEKDAILSEHLFAEVTKLSEQKARVNPFIV